jgi:hypothetical protein
LESDPQSIAKRKYNLLYSNHSNIRGPGFFAGNVGGVGKS